MDIEHEVHIKDGIRFVEFAKRTFAGNPSHWAVCFFFFGTERKSFIGVLILNDTHADAFGWNEDDFFIFKWLCSLQWLIHQLETIQTPMNTHWWFGAIQKSSCALHI